MSDIVRIGDATLIHGDCRDFLPKLGKFDLLLTDPPYVHKHMDGGGFASARKFYAGGEIDFISDFDFVEYAPYLSACSDQLVAFCSRDLLNDYVTFANEQFSSFDLHFWHKTNAIPFTHNTWKSDVEYIVLAWRKKAHNKVEQHIKSKVYISGLCLDDHHPTCKPLPLMEKYVRVLAATAGSVVDPFMGSGTTGVACIQSGRAFTGIERERKYFDIACERISRAYAQGQLFEPTQPKPEQQEIAA